MAALGQVLPAWKAGFWFAPFALVPRRTTSAALRRQSQIWQVPPVHRPRWAGSGNAPPVFPQPRKGFANEVQS